MMPSAKTSRDQSNIQAIPNRVYQDIQLYYNIAGPDYESWSSSFNMHFGYCKSLSNIFFLEKMLRNMNDEVLSRLQLPLDRRTVIADLGCGAGTVARHAAKKFPLSHLTGITISDYQVEKANELIKKEELEEQVSIVKDNFESLHFKSNSFSHAYALESSCHAHGSAKPVFISEMARILQPGGRFCIADGFIKHHRKLPRLFSWLYKKILRYWALPCFATLADFTAELKKNGLVNIEVKEISMRIAPSVAYVPWTCLKFFAKEIWRNKSLRMKKERWHNVYGPVLGMFLGLYRKHFGYYIINGAKP